MNPTTKAAQTLGRIGGQAKSDAKAEASRANGMLGGKPSYVELKEAFDLERSNCIRLIDALRNLRNEAGGFMSMADKYNHGVTNMRCMEHSINEAGKVIAAFAHLRKELK